VRVNTAQRKDNYLIYVLAYYDRVMVVDAGKVVEFDTVLNLFDSDTSIFRSLCNNAYLQREEILRIQKNSVTYA
jgi:ATP-binding cassette subfamily C (CFTR/MRP) protein 1